jgi:hypothetical protein
MLAGERNAHKIFAGNPHGNRTLEGPKALMAKYY